MNRPHFVKILCVIATLSLTSLVQAENKVSILLPVQLEADAGYDLALKELESVLETKRYQPTIHYLKADEPLPDGNRIMVGNFRKQKTIDSSPLKEEAYRIFQAKENAANVLKIEGDRRGGMYGVFKLAEQLQLGKSLWGVSMEMAPEFPMRMYTELGQLYDLPSVGYHLFEEPWVNHERFEKEKAELKRLIDQVAKLGFNTFTILHVNFEDYITYKYLDKEVYGKDDVHHLKAKQFAKHLKDIIDYAHDRHIDVFMQVYEFQYPPKIGELYKLDLENPDMKTIIEAKVKELFEVVPLDGLVITATESLPRSGYKSVKPWAKYGKAGAGKMMTLYHNAGKQYGKKVIFRSWMIAYGAKDSDQVIANTPEDAQFEIKHTGDDFWLNFPLTDAIENGLGKKRPLTMTFDVFPQYYGWSRLLCYQQRFAEETRIAKEHGVIGIQAWGAWAPGCIWGDAHPGYLPNGQLKSQEAFFIDMAGPWNNFRMYSRGFTPGQMNAYLVARLTWDVNLTAEQVARDWGAIHFGKENAAAVAEMLMNSQAAFRELYLGGKHEFSKHPCNFKWATIVNINKGRIGKMYNKLPLSHILERNQVAREYIAKMDDAFARVDASKVPSKEEYQVLKEGLEKTQLYLNLFFKYREMWWRGQDLKKDKAAAKQLEYEEATAAFNDVLEQWQKYPEESRFWGINKRCFKGGRQPWRKDVLQPFKPEYAADANQQADADSWTFCSIPDFLNFDIEYPQEGWEDALGFILDSMQKENPAFAMVAGDLVMGHWGPTRADVEKWADKYYPQWTQRWADHKLKVYTALGDHEVGDNPWRGDKTKLVPVYKQAFRKYLKMPLNGPEHMQGTAFYWTHKNALFISVDVFEEGQSKEGDIAAGVTGKQHEWLEEVLSNHRAKVDHIIVMGHTPVLGPVRTYSSSGMLTVKGRDSAFWQTMAKYGVDLYICGEVHAVTCTQKDGIQQVAHGGLIGRTDKPNYMLVTVKKDRLEVTLKEIDLINGKGRLRQQKKRLGPWDTITITDERKKEGFTPIGHVTIVKKDGKKSFELITGFFDEKNNP